MCGPCKRLQLLAGAACLHRKRDAVKSQSCSSPAGHVMSVRLGAPDHLICALYVTQQLHLRMVKVP
jgi:hypothetical protein